MNVEQRLIDVFQTSARIEPTPDLFSRVVHSIDEDRRHRQRVRRTLAILAAAAVAVFTVGALSIVDGRFGRYVDRPTMEALEAVVLLTLVIALGPAIRRFGRNYAADLWPAGATTSGAILRLLDLAYFLVGIGYILLSTEFEFTTPGGVLELSHQLPDQLADAAVRVGGLVLTLGLLHVVTLFMLPLVALIDNSTRRSRPLPRWVVLLMVLLVVGILPFIQVAIAISVSN